LASTSSTHALPGAPNSLGPTLAETARIAEDSGVSVFTLMDHWFQMEMMATSEDPMLEGYTALGFLAGHTNSMTLGLLLTGVTYRHPGLLAKIVTTLDVLSGGRAQLGIGAAWYEREHRGLGVPFPPLAERFERLEETLQICLQMWSDDNGTFRGRHDELAETICSHHRSARPAPGCSSGAAAKARPYASSPGTPMPAICSHLPPPRSRASSRCSPPTAMPKVATLPRSTRPFSP
jgi:alkanesulfonate monooxygenase SsuD/methylene tetrahydromethanopterin reductase-like flavin-dependent oxidoreductase (luciferase family)